MKIEKEVFGVTYERYSLLKLQEYLVKKLKLESILEIPASGAKAAPSLYSIGFSKFGCKTTLVNPDKGGIKNWYYLNLKGYLKEKYVSNLKNTGLTGNSHDFVWNFVTLQLEKYPELLLEEMKRLSKKYVMVVFVNNFNPGFVIHRLLHKFKKIEWTHGDIRFSSPFWVKRYLKKRGLKIVKFGVLDTPPWPDSLGFRDLRLHRLSKENKHTEIVWEIPILKYIKDNNYPAWIRIVYFWERFPVPILIKIFYSHLYFVLAEK